MTTASPTSATTSQHNICPRAIILIVIGTCPRNSATSARVPCSRFPVTGRPGVGGRLAGNGLVEVILHRWSSSERLHPDEREGLKVEPAEKVTGPNLLSKSYRLTRDFHMHIISGIMDELNVVGQKAILHVSDDLADTQLLSDVAMPNRRGVILLGEYSDDMDTFVGACNTSFAERRRTFEWKMAGAGLPLNPAWTYQGSEHIEDTADGVSRILKHSDRPTAFVCNNDCAAMGVLRAAERVGSKVPDELSVIGLDDVDGAIMVTTTPAVVQFKSKEWPAMPDQPQHHRPGYSPLLNRQVTPAKQLKKLRRQAYLDYLTEKLGKPPTPRQLEAIEEKVDRVRIARRMRQQPTAGDSSTT